MTSALGGYQYESTTARALGSITIESYDHRDQGKTISKLITDVSYMAGLQRKMQKGIDDANENFVQQIQGLIVDFLVILGGGGDTGFDFGDLKYILQAIGSLFGLSPGMPFPINLFSAAWHFFSNYIFPVGNFQELINQIIDSAIATMLDIFGEIPIVGQAVQQLAVFISHIRDLLNPAIEALENLFAAFGGDFSNISLGPFQGIWNTLVKLFNSITEPIAELLSPIFAMVSSWTLPFVDALSHIVELASNLIDMITGGINNFSDMIGGNFNPLAVLTNLISNFIQNGLLGEHSPLNAFNIFGLLRSFNLPFIPFGHIGNKPANLLVEPGFGSEDSIQVGPGWIWDNTNGRTSLGCAKATATGFERTMESVAIEVGEEQKVKAKVWVKWTGLVYTGTNPITVDLIRYADTTELGRTTLAGFVNPATNQPSWYEFVSSDYTIPDDGTNFIKLQFRVRNTATAGQVWFDDADLRKTATGIPQNWILNLIPDILGVRNFIQDVVDAIISAIRGIPFVGGTLANLITWVTGWKEDTDDTKIVAQDTYIGLDNTQKIMVAAATGTALAPEVIPTSQDLQVMDALESQTQALIATNAQLEKLTTQVTGTVTSGVTVIDPVETTSVGELDPTVWQEFTLEGNPEDGYMESADGENISMVTPGGNTSTKMYRRIGEGEHTLTNRQKVTVSISRALVYPGFGDGRRSNYAVYCRVSDDGTKWVRAYYDNVNRLVVDYRNGTSSGVLFNSGQDWTKGPGAGSSLSIEAGFGTNDRMYRILRGGQPIKLVEDTGLVTDITQLGHGIGGRMQGGYGTAKFNQYTAVDNKPAPVPGTYLHVARLTTGSSTINEGANINVFSASPVKQNGIDWNGSVATILTSDTYVITLRIKHSSYISNNNQDACILGLKVDGVEQPLGPSLANGIGGLVGNTPYIMRINALHSVWTLPLNAGQQVQPYLYSNNNVNFPCVGDLNGVLSYMTITRT